MILKRSRGCVEGEGRFLKKGLEEKKVGDSEAIARRPLENCEPRRSADTEAFPS